MTLKRKKEEEILSNYQYDCIENSLIHSFIHTYKPTNMKYGHVRSAIVS